MKREEERMERVDGKAAGDHGFIPWTANTSCKSWQKIFGPEILGAKPQDRGGSRDGPPKV
jgi:hypothetical protein